MANYNTLKTAVADVVKTNGNKEITGALLQQTLLAIVDSLGAQFQFAGVAIPSTNPGTPDQNVAYIAGPGTYPNFNNTTVPEQNIGIFCYNGSWTYSIFQTSTIAVQTISDGIVQLMDGDTPIYPRTKSKAVSVDDNSTLDDVIEELEDTVETPIDFPITIHTQGGTNGYWYSSSGGWVSDNTRRATNKFDVVPGEKYLITTKIGASTALAYVGQWNGETYVGVANGFTGGSGNAQDREYIVPDGVNKIAVCSYDTTNPSLKKVVNVREPKFYTKEESNERFGQSINVKYGVKWGVNNINDLGQRCFGATGLTASIGIGNTNGHSDFDNIWPWSGIKRCNIKSNPNGSKIVTFEGETGFALDGSNGDVFVRIPKFKTDRYIENGEMYVVVGDGNTHPAFIENGSELDEIFVSAFEASISGNALYSKSGVIPANDMNIGEFLAAAKNRGVQYSLYDMRTIDAIWRLMAVEYGCRNSNRIIGYGYSDYTQPAQTATWTVTQAATNTNSVTVGKPVDNATRLAILSNFSVGNNICICEGANVIAQRKITSVACASTNDNIVITFDGAPLDITTNMFVGNAPCDCNYCESIGDSVKLNWHTGRSNKAPLSGSGLLAETTNPCRYRWIENPVGNVWHFLPDIKFNDRQMFVCENMGDYDVTDSFVNYYPKGAILPLQGSNGYKPDVNTVANPNYWITELLNDIFAKGCAFGKSFDTVHDGTLTSQKGYGGYYYLENGIRFIVANGGFDHLWRSNMLTFRAWPTNTGKWYLYGARLMFKNIS